MYIQCRQYTHTHMCTHTPNNNNNNITKTTNKNPKNKTPHLYCGFQENVTERVEKRVNICDLPLYFLILSITHKLYVYHQMTGWPSNSKMQWRSLTSCLPGSLLIVSTLVFFLFLRQVLTPWPVLVLNSW